MKTLDTPRTGKPGPKVFYRSPFRQCCRELVIPSDAPSNAKARMRAIFSSSSRGWSLRLTEEQRERWIAATLNVPSHPSLTQYSHLSGQQLEIKINSTLQCIGKPPVLEPPDPVVFAPSPVIALDIVNDPEAGVRLLLSVGTVTEDIMVFGQPPCSAGRMKHRRVYYLCLLGPATNGQVDFTDLYTAKFGAPRPGQKVFIVTCQTRNGWKAQDHVFSAIVPPPLLKGKQQGNEEKKEKQPAATAKPEASAAPAESASSLSHVVYKRSTPDAQEVHKHEIGVHPVSIPSTPLVRNLRMALQRLGVLGMFRARVEGGAIGF